MSTKINNILFISTEFPPGPGGIGNHAWNLAKQLNLHVPVHVLTVSDYEDEKQCLLFDNKEKMYIYRFKRYNISSITYFKRIFTIIWHIKKYKYSHCILSGKFALYISNILRIFSGNTKLIGILHGSELLPSTKTLLFLLINSLKHLDRIVSVSKYTDRLIPAKKNQ